MAVDIKYLDKCIESVSDAAKQVRDANACNAFDAVADAIEDVHSAMEEIQNAIDDLDGRLAAVENDG
jgi:tRNA A-37 threonylcarbamoyl transferase component Bud32